jgi:hypothetical protein
MILEPGHKILVTHRRLYDTDHGRFFTGVVEGYEAGIARITGHTWVFDNYRGAFQRKEDPRTKIVSLSSGTVIVYQLPEAVDLDSLSVVVEKTGVSLRDRRGFSMDLTESVQPLGIRPGTLGRRSA